jgi:hypothetical protein
MGGSSALLANTNRFALLWRHGGDDIHLRSNSCART